jgi:hypothetical protein
LYVVIWTLVIFVTIPFAREIQKFVTMQWSRELFKYVVIVSTAMAFVSAVIYVRRCLPASRSSYFWLTLTTAIFLGYTVELGRKAPEEAIHFIQYGLLGILVYRALTHRLHDVTVYFAAAIIGGIIGIMDEFIQWLIPLRYWGLRDVWLNFFSAALVQIAIAKGLKPTFVSNHLNRENLRFLCRLILTALIIFGASFLNTPNGISWVAERVSLFEFLKKIDDVMSEYGYLYEDSEIGRFRSRFTPAELKKIDVERATDAAKILDQFQDPSSYQLFLNTYTLIKDPFVHEARVHLFRRDAYYETALKHKADPKAYAEYLTVAFRENQIMEKYFGNTLSNSAYIWSADELSIARSHLLEAKAYDSDVSRNLITRISKGQVACIFIVLIFGVVLVCRHIGKGAKTRSSA